MDGTNWVRTRSVIFYFNLGVFPSLHLKLWSKSIIGRIASMVGTPIHMDKSTATAERLAYARCFIEVSAAHALPTKITLQVEEGHQCRI